MPRKIMDLSELREKYGEADGGTMYTAEARRIAEKIFGKGGYRPAPFAGHPTFLDAPAGNLEPDTLKGLQVAIIGMPMDLGVTNRAGSRFGPRALRAIERVGPYNEGLDIAPLHEMRVADVGDVPFRSRFKLDWSHEDIEKTISKVIAAGTLPLSIGGDHSISLPILRSIGRKRPVGLIHIDAHTDTGGDFDSERFHHGGPFRHAVLEGALDPRRTIQIGIRGPSSYQAEFSHVSGMEVITTKEFGRLGVDTVAARAREVVGAGPTYISFDIDSLDPAYAPGTGTPEVAGLTPREVLGFLRDLKGIDIVGGDVVEVAPAYDATANTAHNAAQVLFEILSLMKFSPSLRMEP